MTEISSAPHSHSGGSFLHKKVGKVPVVYIVGGVVVVLAFYAWRMKSANSAASAADTAAAATGTAAADTGMAASGDAVPPVESGTVIVSPSGTNPADLSNSAITDNDQWLRAGVAFLVAQGDNPGDAQAALQNYLDGNDLTYAQGVLRDKVIRQLGLPPTPNPVIGSTAPRPAPSGGSSGSGAVVPPAPHTGSSSPVVKPVTKANTPTKAPSPHPPSYPGHLIKRGSTGPYVVMIQRRVGATPDGKFGPVTENAVKNFQRSRRLSPDGIVGPLTWKAMFN